MSGPARPAPCLTGGHEPATELGDVASLAVHLMTNTAITGSTYDIDGGQLVASAE